ncbi:MAG: hypothetical protein K0R09_1067 [Clostridiales bacterium]|nr:hypothetical protein [Clostridiales bacterium]
MKIIKFMGVIILTVAMTACSASHESITSNFKFQKKEITDVQSLTSLIDAVNKSGLKILQQRVKNDKNGNVILNHFTRIHSLYG